MASNVCVCKPDKQLEEGIKQFRTRQEKPGQASALVMKVDKESQTIVLEELLENLDSLEELTDSLPDHQPRFIVYSCCLEHADGRNSFPMVFIFFSPRDCKPELQMMYAGSKLELVNKVRLRLRLSESVRSIDFVRCPSNMFLKFGSWKR